MLGIVITIAVLGALVLASIVGYSFIRSQYYVAAETGKVAVYRGIAQKLGPLELSELDETTDVAVDDLSPYSQRRIEQTIPASSRADADKLVENLREEAAQNNAKRIAAEASDNSSDPAPPPESAAPAGDAPEDGAPEDSPAADTGG